ncbi:glycoside hydrolase family 97 catalytic domain-containing protein [Leifsonia sp. LS-T14]|uniref:glycoside hydrolase family 97 catalytic domain-containing protein n=1 Tax=unclassified Leifsonia TaxID=2663824 RepID=UPI0035A73A8B
MPTPEYGDDVVTDTLALAEISTGELSGRVVDDGSGLALHVDHGTGGSLRIRLGVTVRGQDLAAGSEFVRASGRRVVETFTPRSGKTTLPVEKVHEELTVTFADRAAVEWSVVVRAARDGVAVRYEIPDLQGVSTLDGEATALELDAFDRAWMLAYQTWYETPRFGQNVSLLSSGAYGLPALLRRAGDDYVLVAESGIDGRFSGAHAAVDAAEGLLRFEHADAVTEIARGAITPWRVFIIGGMADIVESTLVDELAPAQHPLVEEPSWVRPGRAAWSWWSDFYSGAHLDAQKHFVDVAARLGWEHLLIDCGWEETWVPEIVSYASRFGIQVHLWTVWHDLDGPEKLQRLALWRSWGVAGIKVDFMESESKDRYRWYDSVLQETARLKMMVNFHGSVIPRGWARTWPQVIGYEAIRGSEYYVFYNDTPLTAEHNVIQPFTRNVVGGMDYTPVAFTAPGRTTSDGHELALSVAFECGITHFADGVDAYLARPLAAQFLAELAPRWDETRLLAGTPDTEAVIARRSGDRWFIGCIAAGPARSIEVPLDRIGPGPFDAWIVGDAGNGADGGLSGTRVSAEGSLTVPIQPDGGFVAILTDAGGDLFRAAPVEPATTPLAESDLVELDDDGRATILAAEASTIRVAPGWEARLVSPGRWEVQAPIALVPGGLGVLTLEGAAVRGVPTVSHVRAIRPLSGRPRLSALPMLGFRNESGPVERDMSNGGGNPRDGRRMSIAGEEFDTGLGMSSPGEAHFHLGGRGERLCGLVGIDDETPGAAATAVVEGDGIPLLRVDLAAGLPATPLDVEVSGYRTLTLRTEPRSDAAAHVDWASATLTTRTP